MSCIKTYCVTLTVDTNQVADLKLSETRQAKICSRHGRRKTEEEHTDEDNTDEVEVEKKEKPQFKKM